MDIRTIRYFLEVAQELNITRAAENLHISQPPLSRQIQLLEEELGVKLFDRENHRLHLTEEGVILKNRGGQIIALLDKTEEEVREYRSGVSGWLYISSVEGQGPRLLADWIAGFRDEYPEVQYNLWNGSSDDAIERLMKGLCDLALIVEPFDHESLDSLPVSSEPWVAMIPAGHSLAQAGTDEIDLAELADVPLIVPSRKSRTQEILGWFRGIGRRPRILCELTHYLNALELVSRNVGIAIFPRSTGMDLTSSGVVMKTIVNPVHTAAYVLVWDRQRRLSAAAQRFIGHVREGLSAEDSSSPER